MTINHIPPVFPVDEPDFLGADHPMRKVTRQVAFESGWDSTRAGKVADLFTSMADEWTGNHDVESRYWPLTDALDRGEVQASVAVELGSGTGLGTRILAERFDHVLAFDISPGMLANAPAAYGSRVLADSSSLPLPDATADVVVLVNMLLFPDEVHRILAPAGQVVWVNTVGEQTPIHLPPEDVVAALPGEWHGVTSRAGQGIWLVASRF